MWENTHADVASGDYDEVNGRSSKIRIADA